MKFEIEKLRKRADLLEKLQKEFPDLREYRTYREVVLVSKSVNDKPEQFFTSHTCGCCNDAGLQVWFYVERHGERIFSDPPATIIGAKNPYRLWSDKEPVDIWSDNWEENVKKNIGDVALNMLKSYFKQT